MRRREFLLGASAAAAWASAARAQSAGKLPRVGMLWVNSAQVEANIGLVAAFQKKLAEFGYVDGQTMIVVEKFADGDDRRLDEMAAELARLDVDLIVSGAQGVAAAARATKSIPIVATAMADPIGEGVAASLAHPGGNVTGNAVFFPEIMAKRLDWRQFAPSLKRAGVLSPYDERDPIAQIVFGLMKEAAKALGVELQLLTASEPASYESVFSTASAKGSAVSCFSTRRFIFATPNSSRRSRSNIRRPRAGLRSWRATADCWATP